MSECTQRKFAAIVATDVAGYSGQYARLVLQWIAGIGLEPSLFETQSLRRTEATLIYRRTGNLRTVQLLICHTNVESMVRYLCVEVDDALAIAEQVDI